MFKVIFLAGHSIKVSKSQTSFDDQIREIELSYEYSLSNDHDR